MIIEVGFMVVTGRPCVLLKDKTIDRLPTDFSGLRRPLRAAGRRPAQAAGGSSLGRDFDTALSQPAGMGDGPGLLLRPRCSIPEPPAFSLL